MNNLLSFCGLIDAKIRASEKNLPVQDSYVTTWMTRKKGPGPEMSFFKIFIAKIVGPQQTSPLTLTTSTSN